MGDSGVALDLDSQPNATASEQKAAHLRRTEGQNRTSIQFLIRVHSGMISSLQRRLLSSPTRISMGTSVYIEGPYAGHRATLQPLSTADTILCLVGGIGITNALGFIQEHANTNRQRGEALGKSRGIMTHAKRFILA